MSLPVLVSALFGLLCGVLLVLVFGRWVLAPASVEMRRGYFNAFVTGLLLVAAVEVIPNALTAAGVAGYRALKALAFAGQPPGGDSLWALILQPSQIELGVRGLGAAAVMLLFFRASAVPLTKREAMNTVTQEEGDGPPHKQQGALALPVRGTDSIGLVIIVAGFAGYSLWRGLTQGLVAGASGALSLELTLLAASASLLGISAWGLLAASQQQWWISATASLLLGLAAVVGALWADGRPAIEVGFLPLVLGAGCLVYGTGRLLRLLEHEIGLGWRTTAAVGIGALVLYQSRFIF